MGLTGKLVDQVEIKAVGDLFHESFRDNPHSLSTMTSELHGCDLHEGEFGGVGSIICWQYSDDGNKKYAKDIVTDIDNEKKSIVLKVIEGDLLELYKSFVITYHVDDTGGDNHLVTWTFEYEKLNEDVPDPTVLMACCLRITKDIEAHYLAPPSLIVHP